MAKIREVVDVLPTLDGSKEAAVARLEAWDRRMYQRPEDRPVSLQREVDRLRRQLRAAGL